MSTPTISGSTPTLLDLPPEILSKITSYLKVDLYNFTLVSRECSQITQALLHPLPSPQPLILDAGSEGEDHADLYTLLRDLARGRVDPAGIKHLTVWAGDECDMSEAWKRSASEVFSTKDWNKLKE